MKPPVTSTLPPDQGTEEEAAQIYQQILTGRPSRTRQLTNLARPRKGAGSTEDQLGPKVRRLRDVCMLID